MRNPTHINLLAAVSRSFYLSLRFLPREVRGELSLAYLLARATDTIADSEGAPDTKRQRLEEFAKVLESDEGRGAERFCAALLPWAATIPHAGEKALLLRLRECFEAWTQLPGDGRELMRAVLGKIIEGQNEDVVQFASAETAALPDAAAVERYTYLVAGCVGEYWTALCAARIERFAQLPSEEMRELGIALGKGLQLVNILRDQPKDMVMGRCYLPMDELKQAGVGDLHWPADDWHQWHAVRSKWLAVARERLAAGARYADALHSRRLAFAVRLPALLGEATLDLLSDPQNDQAPVPAKVTRQQVRSLALKALRLALWK